MVKKHNFKNRLYITMEFIQFEANCFIEKKWLHFIFLSIGDLWSLFGIIIGCILLEMEISSMIFFFYDCCSGHVIYIATLTLSICLMSHKWRKGVCLDTQFKSSYRIYYFIKFHLKSTWEMFPLKDMLMHLLIQRSDNSKRNISLVLKLWQETRSNAHTEGRMLSV